MANSRVFSLFPSRSSRGGEFLIAAVSFVVAIGVACWFLYGMLRELRRSPVNKVRPQNARAAAGRIGVRIERRARPRLASSQWAQRAGLPSGF